MGNPFKEADATSAQPNLKVEQPKAKVMEKAEDSGRGGEVQKTHQERKAATEKREAQFSADAVLTNKLKKKKSAGTRAFYIDDDVYEELEKLAKKNEVGISPTLNTLLRAMLFNE